MVAKRKSKADISAELETLIAQNAQLTRELAKARGEVKKDFSALKSEIGGLNAEMESLNLGAAVAALMDGSVLSARVKEMALKSVIGFVYGYTLGIVGSSVVTAIALLAMPVWIAFVLKVLVALVVVWTALVTISPVTNVIYNGVGTARKFVSREAHDFREWLTKATHDMREQYEQRTALRDKAHAVVQ